MGLGRSVLSESEKNTGDITADEKSIQPNTPRRVGKQNHAIDNEILPPDPHHEIVLKFQKLQMDNVIEERNHSERIIREKEKLLKEKEETIRQQANLIKTQNELLGQRKQRRMISNVGTVKPIYDKMRPSKQLSKPSQFIRPITSLENIHSNGQDPRNRVTADDDYGQKYYDAEPYPPKRQEKQSQKFSMQNTAIGNFAFSNPFPRDSRSSSSTVAYQTNYHASNIVPSSNSNGLLSKPISRQQLRRTQSNDYRRNIVSGDELSEQKQSTDQLLADLEKQTNYEVQKLDNAQNGDRPLKQVTGIQGVLKCSGCRLARKYKTAPVGAPQKCKKCGGDVSSRLTQKSCKSDDESRSHHLWNSDSEFISDVD